MDADITIELAAATRQYNWDMIDAEGNQWSGAIRCYWEGDEEIYWDQPNPPDNYEEIEKIVLENLSKHK